MAEPAQPKIKLKVGQVEVPSSSKKITIHVGRGGSADSPAPHTTQSADSPASSANVNGIGRPGLPGQPNLGHLEKARSVSASVASPSPSLNVGLKTEDSAHMSPAGLSQPLTTIPGQATPGFPRPQVPPAPAQPPLVNGFVEQKKLRADGKGSLRSIQW